MEFPLSRKCRRCTIMIKGRFMFTAHCFRRTTRDCFYANTSKCYNLRGVSYDAKVTWVKIMDHYHRLQVSFQDKSAITLDKKYNCILPRHSIRIANYSA
ncbi:uncharacterized protein LOC122720530 [Apis laboriosa]|uniref:uncharacterized protein LOC122720530 n=1 Tax=Apis laboriosa TaxID=183418 RepID=UPI001CC40718|nr:uncharacterized protein LOC122720530 [Apis laboriosa]